MLSPIWTAAAAAPATPALTDPVLASTSLASSTLTSAAPAKTAHANSKLPTAMPSRGRPGAGTWLCLGGSAVPHDRATARLAVAAPSLTAAGQSLIARRHASNEAVAFGAGTRVAGQAEFARPQRADMKFSYPMALIAPTGGGGVGPYPARDPV